MDNGLEEWRKGLAAGSVVYLQDGGRGVIVGAAISGAWLVKWDAGSATLWEWTPDELWPTDSTAKAR